jgi:ABC-type Fe3+/spermidine/putrescine transport system ATPase subunit
VATTTLRLESQPVRLEGVTKLFGKTAAVDDVTFEAQAGRLTTLLGPSGCGKTTTLRMIGGFYEPDAGSIHIGTKFVNAVPPHARSTRTVFQSYALFPHMTVFENVAFGLRATRVPRGEIGPRVDEALELVGLTGLAQRSSGQLSGGQQQRVAFARALVTRPEVLLLDEPLSNLDAKLRVHMRGEIRSLQQDLGITTIYVTHDQEEAMSLSDHVVVMQAGRIDQQGPPHDIYERPATRFVADFIGTSNFVEARVETVAADVVGVAALGATLRLAPPVGAALRPGEGVLLVLRPEHLHLQDPDASDGVGFPGRVASVAYLGAVATYEVALDGGATVTVDSPAPVGAALRHAGDPVRVRLQVDRVYVVPSAGDEGAEGADERS